MDFTRSIVSGVIGSIIVGVTDFEHIGNILIFAVTFGVVGLVFELAKKDNNEDKITSEE